MPYGGFRLQIPWGAWPEGPPAYRTGAIGDKGTCHADECHNSYSLNSGNAKLSIIAPPIYSAGKSVKIEVSFSNTQGIAYGFEMTAVDANGKRVGKFKKITHKFTCPTGYCKILFKVTFTHYRDRGNYF
ncbi:conserved hypothetical protein [Candidatus Brocadia pituitae]|nr:conserved hypothetical protein [Candidatus Brocadia pituitae]